MSRKCRVEDVEFVLDVLDLHPGMAVLAIEVGTMSAAVAEHVGRGGRVFVAPTLTRAHEWFGQHGPFDRICAVGAPDLRTDADAAAAFAPLLADGGQLWVIDEAMEGEDTGTVSLTVSTLLAQAGFAIVDILERGSRVAVWAAVGRPDHG